MTASPPRQRSTDRRPGVLDEASRPGGAGARGATSSAPRASTGATTATGPTGRAWLAAAASGQVPVVRAGAGGGSGGGGTAAAATAAMPALAAPAPARAPEAVPGARRLEVVGRSPRRRRVRMAVVAVGLALLGALLANAMAHAVLVTGQRRLDDLQQSVRQEQARQARLRLREADLESPQRIVDQAQAQGMIVPPGVTYIVEGSDGSVAVSSTQRATPPTTAAPPAPGSTTAPASGATTAPPASTTPTTAPAEPGSADQTATATGAAAAGSGAGGAGPGGASHP